MPESSRAGLRGLGLVVAGLGSAVIVLVSLVVIVVAAPQKPRVPTVGQPAPTPVLSASDNSNATAPDDSSPAAPTATVAGASPTASPSARPSPGRSPAAIPHRTPGPKPPPNPQPAPNPPPPVRPVSYEAESPANVLGGFARPASMIGASGGAGVFALGAPNLGTLRFTRVSAPAAGRYTLTIYFQNPDFAARTGQVSVNGGAAVTMRYPSTGCFSVRSISMPVTLNAGTGNTIQFGNPVSRAADIDRIVISA
jgi:hypothetical protein